MDERRKWNRSLPLFLTRTRNDSGRRFAFVLQNRHDTENRHVFSFLPERQKLLLRDTTYETAKSDATMKTIWGAFDGERYTCYTTHTHRHTFIEGWINATASYLRLKWNFHDVRQTWTNGLSLNDCLYITRLGSVSARWRRAVETRFRNKCWSRHFIFGMLLFAFFACDSVQSI